LLCGYPPFESDNESDLLNEMKNGEIKFDSSDWENISDSAKDLVAKLLTFDQQKRIKA